MKRIAVLPGSYDPITIGHEDLIRRARDLFGKCEVLVMNNADKKHRYSLEDRARFCREAFRGEENIAVFSSDGMLFEYVLDRPEAVIVKGVRSEADFQYEEKMARFNFEHSGVETVFLPSSPALSDLSSTEVRRRMDDHNNWETTVPEKIVEMLKKQM